MFTKEQLESAVFVAQAISSAVVYCYAEQQDGETVLSPQQMRDADVIRAFLEKTMPLIMAIREECNVTGKTLHDNEVFDNFNDNLN